MSQILDLLSSLNIHISETDWNAVHGIETQESSLLNPHIFPNEPVGYDSDEDDRPIFLSSQLEWCEPELYGFMDYTVVEDEETAHPIGMNYNEEMEYRSRAIPIHRYDRKYRIRKTFEQLLGHIGTFPEDVRIHLTQHVAMADKLQTRGAYEWIRDQLKQLKRSDLYISIPFIIRALGGPRWIISFKQCNRVLDEALRFHGRFDHFKKCGVLDRMRFPKMQYVLMWLLDKHKVVPPYRVPWARTSIKRRQLHLFLADLDQRPLY